MKNRIFISLEEVEGSFIFHKDPPLRIFQQISLSDDAEIIFYSKDDREASLFMKYKNEKLNKEDILWSGVVSNGPISFDEFGVLKKIIDPLALRGISILAFSTYSRDYIFFPLGSKKEVFESFKEENIHVTKLKFESKLQREEC